MMDRATELAIECFPASRPGANDQAVQKIASAIRRREKEIIDGLDKPVEVRWWDCPKGCLQEFRISLARLGKYPEEATTAQMFPIANWAFGYQTQILKALGERSAYVPVSTVRFLLNRQNQRFNK